VSGGSVDPACRRPVAALRPAARRVIGCGEPDQRLGEFDRVAAAWSCTPDQAVAACQDFGAAPTAFAQVMAAVSKAPGRQDSGPTRHRLP